MNINVSIHFRNKSAKDLFGGISDYDYDNVAGRQILAKKRNEHNQRDIRPEVNKSKENHTNITTTTTTTPTSSIRITAETTPSTILLRSVRATTTDSVSGSTIQRQKRDISSSAPTSMHGKW